MSYMFSGCSSLVNLDLSNFETNKVNNMENMFNECNSLKKLNLSKFNISNGTNVENMFGSNKNYLVIHNDQIIKKLLENS